ncbi:STAS domain-containing protein [Marinobacterium weihaiense]|uniref:STAS domain-containing protein n=1 Tax=Marinobacterium weihaiense TaxID=2851016 RepID=A0ABS6M9W5_9GAMM|nr:STAS domain-containing protein [Marinobacterium weihaiense]MBV0933078.1 STAS domain-containing protein [Marinobacterium weihaiense]
MTAAKVERSGDAQVALSGDLTFATVLQIRTPLLQQLKACGEACVLDLSAVERVDSSALSLWLVCQRQARRLSQRLTLCGVPEDFHSIAGLVGLADGLD